MLESKAKFYFYRNLHTKTFSVQRHNRVQAHPSEAIAFDCTFVVSKIKQARVRATRVKNVHARVACRVYDHPNKHNFKIKSEITYNPYTHDYFMMNGERIDKTETVLLMDNKVFLIELL
jgi:hypothetical protein